MNLLDSKKDSTLIHRQRTMLFQTSDNPSSIKKKTFNFSIASSKLRWEVGGTKDSYMFAGMLQRWSWFKYSDHILI